MEPVAYVFCVTIFRKDFMFDRVSNVLFKMVHLKEMDIQPRGGGLLNKLLYREALPRDSNPYPVKY